ncbi:hypothetical protein [Thermohalobaculum xanthum]|nr:hypothetical protein [Thermohalobaculum xanthum]
MTLAIAAIALMGAGLLVLARPRPEQRAIPVRIRRDDARNHPRR